MQTLHGMSSVRPGVESVEASNGEVLGYDTPFDVYGPETDVAPVIFSSPHSGSFYPASVQSVLRVPLMDLRRTEDAFVDDLFRDAPSFGAWLVAARYGRNGR